MVLMEMLFRSSGRAEEGGLSQKRMMLALYYLISLKKLPMFLIPECLLMYMGGKGRLYVNNLEHIR